MKKLIAFNGNPALKKMMLEEIEKHLRRRTGKTMILFAYQAK